MRKATSESTVMKMSIMLHLPSESSHEKVKPREAGEMYDGGANQSTSM